MALDHPKEEVVVVDVAESNWKESQTAPQARPYLSRAGATGEPHKS